MTRVAFQYHHSVRNSSLCPPSICTRPSPNCANIVSADGAPSVLITLKFRTPSHRSWAWPRLPITATDNAPHTPASNTVRPTPSQLSVAASDPGLLHHPSARFRATAEPPIAVIAKNVGTARL